MEISSCLPLLLKIFPTTLLMLRWKAIYLMGYALHLCVESTLRQAHDLGYNTHVIYDASAAFTREQQTAFVNDIVPFYGRAVTTQDFLKSAN